MADFVMYSRKQNHCSLPAIITPCHVVTDNIKIILFVMAVLKTCFSHIYVSACIGWNCNREINNLACKQASPTTRRSTENA